MRHINQMHQSKCPVITWQESIHSVAEFSNEVRLRAHIALTCRVGLPGLEGVHGALLECPERPHRLLQCQADTPDPRPDRPRLLGLLGDGPKMD